MASRPYAYEIEVYYRNVIDELHPRSVILYGSMATGEFGVGSDIDIVVVSENLPRSFLERLRILSELNTTMAPIEALGYTSEEFLEMLERRHPTALYAVVDGKPLHDDGFFLEAQKKFEIVKARFDLARVEHGWEARALTERASTKS